MDAEAPGFYEKAALRNTILIGCSKGVAAYTAKEALEWGTTGAGLRATGIGFDVRKWRPYSGYENFDFEIPTGGGVSDCYTRVMLKVEELRQSLRILQQCLDNMPEGPFKADHPLTTPPPKERTLQHIETLITHFLQVSRGPVMPANESFQMVEATKGINSYYSDQRRQHHELPYPYSYPELCAPAADPGGDPRQPGIRPYRLSG